MTKTDTRFLKGVAILMMLFLHLFNDPALNAERFAGDGSWLLGGEDGLFLLCRCAVPVELFLLLGGYGLAAVNERGHDVRRWKRWLRPLLAWWLVLLLMVPVARWLTTDESYSLDIKTILLNLSGLDTSWYREAWFLLPYMLLSVSSCWLLKALQRLGTATLLMVALAVHGASAWLLRSGQVTDVLLLLLLNVGQMLLPFVMGMALRRHRLPERFRQWCGVRGVHGVVLLVLLLAISVVRLAVPWRYVVAPLYALVVVLTLQATKKPHWTGRPMELLGDLSLYMWMTHAWFCKYVFRDMVYGVGHPLTVFLFLLLLSVLSAWLLRWLVERVGQMLMP